MSQLDYTVPGLLFPAISFFMLAATQRFMGAASVIRQLHSRYLERPDPVVLAQIDNLRFRVSLTRAMQTLGALALLLNTATIFALYLEHVTAARSLFGTSLMLLLLSIATSVWEIHISVRAIDLQIGELKRRPAA
ncbi:MAG TPA: DUF2721 domain-containing protein [Solimonas sp.]|nr:DUF2721 domain-containing protein [Solimonas sp.]